MRGCFTPKAGFAAAVALFSGLNASHAAESAAGAYILGIRGPGAAVTPPTGLFFSNQFYIYEGKIAGRVPFDGGTIAGNARVPVAVNIPTLLFVTPAEIAGGRLGVTLTVPFGYVGPSGQIGPIRLSDSVTTFADPSVGAFLGWRATDFHWQFGFTAFLPIGDYRKGSIANVAKHRGALDVFGSLTWIEPSLGLDVSNTFGFTFNIKNEATNYRTGNEFHWDWSITKKFQNGISIGPAGYYYRQLTGDSGSGAILGGFKGEVVAIGGGIGYEFKIGQLPVTTRVRYFHEIDTRNRLKGDAVFLGVSFPLWVPQPRKEPSA